MAAHSQVSDEALSRAFHELQGLRDFSGPPDLFWAAFLEALLSLARARAVLVAERPVADAAWQKSRLWPVNSLLFHDITAIEGPLDQLANLAWKEGSALLSGDAAGMPAAHLVAVRLDTAEKARAMVAMFRLDGVPQDAAVQALVRLRIAAETPLIYQLNAAAREERQKAARFASTLDLLVVLGAEKHFRAAAMTLCNELAARHRCDRVSLGWLVKNYVRLQAISHSDKFEKKMAVVRALESAMEEALDQDAEIVWPPPAAKSLEGEMAAGPIARSHEEFARAQVVNHMASLPIRLNGRAMAVLTLERASGAFSVDELQSLRLLCDQAAGRLGDLQLRDRWIGARVTGVAREKLAGLFGVEHTLAKVTVIAALIALDVLIFAKKSYRVEAPFVVKSDTLAQLAAPFEGYIDEVRFRIGDPVETGQVLLSLDERDLLLQEAAAAAERRRYLAEAQKAESASEAADMRIALASAEQAKARLELVQHHLSQAKIRAPFAGFVVEGDLRERVAAPVKQGEVLLKVAKIEAMYPRADVPERDIHEIREGATGEIAFASRPQFTFPVRVERIEPVAESKEKGNIFTVRCVFTGDGQGWWRPGMSGVCKIDAGKRSLLWIFTHRTVDFLRLHFWW
jgi:RND family efflux transporter MFP subunit